MSGVVVVSGGTRGLGLAVAQKLAADGWTPALLFQSDEAAATLAESSIDGSRAYACDVRDSDGLEATMNGISGSLGPIRAVVTCAFRSRKEASKTHEVPVDSWREDIDVNLTGTFLTVRAALPHLLDNKGGRIVCVGSLAARGEPGRVAYATSKAALEGFIKTVAQEYARDAITANLVHPGFFELGAFNRLSDDVQQRALKRVPMRRAGKAAEIGSAVSYLLNPESAYVTGQVLRIDGGVR